MSVISRLRPNSRASEWQMTNNISGYLLYFFQVCLFSVSTVWHRTAFSPRLPKVVLFILHCSKERFHPIVFNSISCYVDLMFRLLTAGPSVNKPCCQALFGETRVEWQSLGTRLSVNSNSNNFTQKRRSDEKRLGQDDWVPISCSLKR